MELVMKEFAEEHLPEMTEIWNDVVEEGISFPGDKALSEKEALKMFREQASTVCATLNGEVVGGAAILPMLPTRFGRTAAERESGGKWCAIAWRTQGKRGFAGSSLTL